LLFLSFKQLGHFKPQEAVQLVLHSIQSLPSTLVKMTVPQYQNLQIEVQQEGNGDVETQRGKIYQLPRL